MTVLLRPHNFDTWEVMEAFTRTTPSGVEITVPKGFITDLDSVPRVPFVFYMAKGRTVEAAIVHDFLYRNSEMDRLDADNIFYDLMIQEGVSKWRAWYIYSAVRMFGRFAR